MALKTHLYQRKPTNSGPVLVKVKNASGIKRKRSDIIDTPGSSELAKVEGLDEV